MNLVNNLEWTELKASIKDGVVVAVVKAGTKEELVNIKGAS